MTMLVDENSGNLFVENPIFSNLKGLRKAGRIFVNLDDILIDPSSNTARYGGTNSSLIERLKLSFMNSVRFNDFLPIITKLSVNRKYDDGHLKFYELVDGFNRISALKDLGYTHYWFDVAEFGFDDVDPYFAMKTLAIASNPDVPKEPSSDKDLFVSVTDLVTRGYIQKDFEKIKSYIREIAKVTPARAHNIASQVAAATGTQNTLFIWSTAMIKGDLASLGIQSHGKFDTVRNKHGWTVLEGYEPDVIMNAVAKFSETGKESYFVGHTKIPDSDNNLEDRRMRVKSNLEEKKQQLISVCEYYAEHKKLPFDLIGFLPQSEVEDRKNLVKIK